MGSFDKPRNWRGICKHALLLNAKIMNANYCSDPLEGEELYTQLGFFLFREFSPLDIFIVES